VTVALVCSAGPNYGSYVHIVNLAFYKKHNILKNCRVLVKILAISDITALFPNKMRKKSIWRLGVKNPQTMWRYKG